MSPEAQLEEAIHALCERAALTPTGIEWMPAELSLRRFARVHLAGPAPASLVARVEAAEDPAGRPAGVPPEPPLEPIRRHLEDAGLPVPASYGIDEARGIQLLEDVGTLSLRDAVPALRAEARWELHAEACAWVPKLQATTPADGIAAFDRKLDAPLFAYKGELVIDHGLPSRGRATTPAEAEVVRAAFRAIRDGVADAPHRLAHRDYQSANLFVTLDAPVGAQLRMIDFQGAFLAPPEYDLVSLLCDSYLEIPEARIEALREGVRSDLPDAPDPASFARRFDLLTLSRKGKDHARFLYAARQRGDERYLRYAPHTVRLLRRAAERLASTDARLAAYAELVCALPESPCAR